MTTCIDDYYYYGVNSRGDVEALYNEDGTLHAKYDYDAYGKLISVKASDGTDITATYAIAVLNPLRYRSYVYDNESGLYYLQSRYYDPTTCRFINADGYISTGQGITGYNMFAYCGNNPVERSDPNGQGWIIAVVVAVVTVAAFAVDFVNRSIDAADLSDAEKALVKENYLTAYIVLRSREITKEYIDQKYGAEYDKDDTQVNAVKHAMWNAVMTDKIGADKAELYANAHEDRVGNELLSMEMDLINNELGRKIALEYEGQGYDVFFEKIVEAINNGEGKVIKWDSNIN